MYASYSLACSLRFISLSLPLKEVILSTVKVRFPPVVDIIKVIPHRGHPPADYRFCQVDNCYITSLKKNKTVWTHNSIIHSYSQREIERGKWPCLEACGQLVWNINSTEAETMRKCLAFVRVNGKNRLPKVVLRSLHICSITCVPILTHITHRDYSGGRS